MNAGAATSGRGDDGAEGSNDGEDGDGGELAAAPVERGVPQWMEGQRLGLCFLGDVVVCTFVFERM